MLTEFPLLEIKNLSVEFRIKGSWVPVVENVTLSVEHSQTVALVGESGSGKSVLATAIIGLIGRKGGRISSGEIWLDGTELVGASERVRRGVRGREISMIFQNPMRSLNPSFTAGEQIAEVARVHLGMSRKASEARAIEMLDVVGIPQATQRAKDYPHMFSGGMAQRLAIAVALCGDPKLLIADEPTTALDVTVQAKILDLLGDLQKETGFSILFISHDLGVVADIANRAVVMYAGEVVEAASISDVFLHPQHPYTSALLKAIPILGAGRRDLEAIPGSIPQPGERPTDCRFASRCALRVAEICDGIHPALELSDTSHVRCLRAHDLELEGVQVQ